MTLVSSPKWGMRFVGLIGLLSLVGGLLSCGRSPQAVPPRTLEIQQQWQMQPGTQVAGYVISGGLGDISVEIRGAGVYAPFDGDVQPLNDDCVIYSSPDVPAYVFRLCGLDQIQWGDIAQGAVIGRGESLQFAALRKQPEGQWAMVEPSRTMLEKMLTHD
ncbi:MAG: hypothetical protein WBA57_16615 [Elainellaceae cyanobacterium]